MTKIDLSEIVYDPKIYPREKWKTKTIESYADALKGGATFPPLILEIGTNKLLDGVHRWKAYLKYQEAYQNRQPSLNSNNNEWPEPSSEIEVKFSIVPDGIPAKLYAASFSTTHGDRITGAERKALAREVYEDNPDFTLSVLKEYLNVSIGSAHGYVSDILARRKEQQKTTAFRLHLLGWTQEEIGKVIGVSQQAYQQKFLQDFSDLKKVVKKLLNEGHPHLDVAERYNMPLQLVWAIDLEDRTDAQRFERLGIGNPQPYDVWKFGKCSDLFGNRYPGRIPGQLIAHVLYFFTESGAIVIDPMCGSGTTVDVCMAYGRKCYAYDIDQRYERPDIIQHNLTDGWPERTKKANLIFWDPPYFEKMDSKKIGDNGYIKGSISSLARDDYLAFFAKALAEAKRLVKPKTKLAFLMSDWDDNTGKRSGVFIWDYAKIINEAGWNLTRHIQIPLSTQQVHPDIVNKFRKSRRLARLERYLLIAEA